MTVRDMHIDIKLATQQMAANKTRKFYPEEIDWVLNTVMDRFIESKLKRKKDGSGGFELDESGVDDIRTLLVSNLRLPSYILDDQRMVSYLPYDYRYLISDSSIVDDLCNTVSLVSTKTLYIYTLEQPYSKKVAPMFYEKMTINIGISIFEFSKERLPPANNYTGYRERADIGFLAPYMALRSKLYWERFGSLYVPQAYITPSDLHIDLSDINISIDDEQVDANLSETVRLLNYYAGTGKRTNNRLTASDKISAMNQAAFFKTRHYSPISELVDESLIIYRDDSFTVKGAEVTYIRKPRPISLSLGNDCDLPASAHSKICALAAEYILGTVGDTQGFQIKKVDVADRVTL